MPTPSPTHIQHIKASYDAFEQSLLQQGQLLAKDTGIGYWGVTHIPALATLFSQISPDKKHLVDLGSGDGRVVLLASLFGMTATGIEADDWLLNTALHMKRTIGLPHFSNTQFHQEDFMKHGLGKYDFLYCSPDKPFHRGLEQKLLRELRGKLIVHSFEFLPQRLVPEKEFLFHGEKFGVYGNR